MSEATVHKFEIIVIDREGLSPDEVADLITTNRYLSAHLLTHKSKEIADWSDDHPLNRCGTFAHEVYKLFGATQADA